MADNRNQTADKLKKHVHDTFEHVRKALDLRERLLTRQIDVLMNTTTRPNVSISKSMAGRPLPLIDQLKFLPQNEPAVLEHIRRLGKFNVDNYKFYSDPTFAIEDYICPNVDHELMYKCLLKCNDDDIVDEQQLQQLSLPVVNVANIVELEQQIAQLTQSESMELIDGARRHEPEEFDAQQGLDNATDEQRIAKMLIENLNNDQPCSKNLEIPQTSQTHKGSKKSKRKLKNHNGSGLGCSGTINLKNISSLTINTMCSRENSVKKSSKSSGTDKKQQQSQPDASEAHSAAALTATANGTNSTPVPKSTSDLIMDTHSTMENSSNAAMSDGTSKNSTPIDYGCEFYNRLIAEIKHTMKAQQSTAPNTATVPQVTISRQHRQIGCSVSSPTSTSTAFSSPMSLSMSTSSSSSSNVTSTPFALSTASEMSSVSSKSTSPAAAVKHECSKMLFQNIHNLRITLPSANVAEIQTPCISGAAGTVRTDQPPALIEEWLKQIGSQTEVEPSAGADILEHSLIHESNLPNHNDE